MWHSITIKPMPHQNKTLDIDINNLEAIFIILFILMCSYYQRADHRNCATCFLCLYIHHNLNNLCFLALSECLGVSYMTMPIYCRTSLKCLKYFHPLAMVYIQQEVQALPLFWVCLTGRPCDAPLGTTWCVLEVGVETQPVATGESNQEVNNDGFWPSAVTVRQRKLPLINLNVPPEIICCLILIR